MTDLMGTAPADAPRARLGDPQVAGALNTLLDNADVLALAALSIDGLLRRGDTITANLNDGLKDFRSIAESAAFLMEPTRRLAEEAPDIADAAEALLDSGMFNREVVTLLGRLAPALAVVNGTEAANRNRTSMSGIIPLFRALTDPDVGRGDGLMIEIVRALGRTF